MDSAWDRRRFLQSAAVWSLGAGLAGVGRLRAAEPGRGAPHGEKLGWKLACAAYSFNELTFFEAIDQTAALGLAAIEGFTWQPLCPDRRNVLTNAEMSAADRREMAKKLADTGVHLVSCYCQQLDEPTQARRVYEWAQELGIGTLVAEPSLEAYDGLEKLCEEYRINLAVHNHPQPSHYWNPATLLQRSQGRGPRIGACCDTGHWVRSGLQPVEALQRLQGRILTLHLKDVASFGHPEADCVPWGQGAGQIEAILQELRRQGFRGYLTIEYEPYTPQNAAKVAACIAYFDQVAARLLGA